MLRNFKIKIDNFGPIHKADLEVSKINIISGKNASGKTTMSKLIYCILTTFSNDGEFLTYKSMKDRLSFLIEEILKIQNIETSHIKEIIEIKISIDMNNNFKLETIKKCYDRLYSIIESQEFNNKEYFLSMIENDKKTLEGISSPDFYHALLFNLIRNEFVGDEQILDNFNNSDIVIYNDSDNPFEYNIIIDNALNIDSYNEFENFATNREAIYIETPYFLDYYPFISQITFNSQIPYHQVLLSRKLKDKTSKNDILDEMHNENIVKFQNQIHELIGGEFNQNNNGIFEFKQNGKTFNLQNTSPGLKSMGILQILLENRKLNENSFLIMDEPEVHLHPEWQLKLAKILVLLSKELNVNLFINSHSPQFIEAMEVYSGKYGFSEETKFYLSQEESESGKYNVNEIERKNLTTLYNNLGTPYDKIDEIRIENAFNGIE